MDDMINEHLSKAIKIYNDGKKLYESNNKNKAIKLFEQSLNMINEFKKLNPNNITNINTINNTEAECIKYLSMPPDVFDLVTKNNIETIKNLEYINFREINDKGNTVLHHSIDVGDMGILK